MTTAKQLALRINTQGSIVLRGAQQLELLRVAIEEVMKAAGFQVTFEPDSAPDLVSYLTASTLRGLEGAALGSLVGGLVGAFFNSVGTGAAAGAAIGATVGIVRGIDQVQRGWRIRAFRDDAGEAVVEVTAT